MEEEKKAQSKEELTDETLDTVSGGIIVMDIHKKYTVYDDEGNNLGTKDDFDSALELARDKKVGEALITEQAYNYIKRFKLPPDLSKLIKL